MFTLLDFKAGRRPPSIRGLSWISHALYHDVALGRNDFRIHTKDEAVARATRLEPRTKDGRAHLTELSDALARLAPNTARACRALPSCGAIREKAASPARVSPPSPPPPLPSPPPFSSPLSLHLGLHYARLPLSNLPRNAARTFSELPWDVEGEERGRLQLLLPATSNPIHSNPTLKHLHSKPQTLSEHWRVSATEAPAISGSRLAIRPSWACV